MESSSTTYCYNCKAKVTNAYCSQCGQRTSVHKVSFKETVEDFVDSVFSIRAPLWITIKHLIINPGRLLGEYLDGQRKTYYKPVSFFILTTLIYLIIRSAIDFQPFENSTIVVEDTNAELPVLSLARDFMLININKLLFIFVFSLALFSKLFFYKKYSLAEFLAISFYLVGMYTIITTFNMFFIKYLNPNMQTLAAIIMWGYFVYAMITLFKSKKLLTGIKAIIVYILSYLSYVFLAFGLSYLIVLFQKN